MFDAPKGPMESIHIPFTSIETIGLKKRPWGTKLTVLCKSPRDLQNFPLPAGSLNELVCSVRKKHLQQAEMFAAESLLKVAELFT